MPHGMRYSIALIALALAVSLALPATARAQGAAFPDIPTNHWAYQAVQDLANKGYVKGYPDGKFLGNRSLSRYEFATVIDRMAQELDEISRKAAAGQAPATPTGAPVTQDDLDKIQVLVDAFKEQLAAIQSTAAADHAHFQAEIDSLRAQVAAVKTEADNSYGAGKGRKYTISGYIQARYLAVGSDNAKDYPQGSPTSSSAYNGAYAQGGNTQSFIIRRSRLKVAGQPTANTRFAIQIDASGFANNTPSSSSNSSNAAVSVKEGWASYTFGDGNMNRNPTLTAGQFATPFGYMLPLSTATMFTPERPLAFNEGSAGLFTNQDYDRGLQLAFSPSYFRFLIAAINGSGATGNDESHGLDEIYKAGIHTKGDTLSADVSYYDGHVPYTKGVGTSYIFQKKQLWDIDAQAVSPAGPFLLGEYVAGTFEQRSFFGETAATSTNPFGFGAAPAPGNKVKGYYVQGGWQFSQKAAHPWSLFFDYDVLDRSDSGAASGATGGASGASFDDENVGYGAIYNLDQSLRLRLYYVKPDKVAHMSGTPEPPRVGMTTAEMQVSF